MTSAVNVRPARAGGWLVLAVIFVAFLGVGAGDAALGVLWPRVSVAVGLPLEALGVVLAVATGGFVLVSLSLGPLTARIGLGWLLVLGLAARLVGLWLVALVPTLPALLVGYALIGVGGAVVVTGLSAYLAATAGAGRMNVAHANFGLGATLAPLLASGLLQAGFAWSATYLVIGALFAVLLPVVVLTRSVWEIAATDDEPATVSAPVGETLRLTATWVGVALFFFYAGTEISTGQWAFSILTAGRGFDEVTASQWVSIFWGVFTGGRLLMGVVSERVATARLVRWQMSLAVGALLLWWWQPGAWSNPLALGALGLALAPIYPVMMSATPGRVGKRHAANVIGFQSAAASLGAAAIPALAGALSGWMSLAVIPLLLGGTALTVLVLAEVLAWLARRRVVDVVVSPGD